MKYSFNFLMSWTYKVLIFWIKTWDIKDNFQVEFPDYGRTSEDERKGERDESHEEHAPESTNGRRGLSESLKSSCSLFSLHSSYKDSMSIIVPKYRGDSSLTRATKENLDFNLKLVMIF